MTDINPRVRRLGKKLLRKAGIDIRFIPELGFDAYDDMNRLAGGERPPVLDVGPNLRQTIHRARKTFAQPVIHAFEPGRDTFADLSRRMAGIPDLHLNNVALGERAAARTFFDHDPPAMSHPL